MWLYAISYICLSREPSSSRRIGNKGMQEKPRVESRKFPLNYRFGNKISPLCELIPMITPEREILFARYVAPHSYYHSQYRLSPVAGRVICSLVLWDDGWVIYDVLEKYTRLARKPLRTHNICCDNNEEKERHEKNFSDGRKVFIFLSFNSIK